MGSKSGYLTPKRDNSYVRYLGWVKPWKFAVIVSIDQKTKTKKIKRRQRANRETKFSRVRWLGEEQQYSFYQKPKLVIFLQTEDMMEWLIDRLCNVIEIKNNEMIQSFVVERIWNQWFLSKKIFCTSRSRKKKMFSKIWPQNSLREKGKGTVWNSMEACEGYKVIEKFEKFCS